MLGCSHGGDSRTSPSRRGGTRQRVGSGRLGAARAIVDERKTPEDRAAAADRRGPGFDRTGGDHMETVSSKDGTTIAFERTGKGPTLVVVGGALNDRGDAASLAALLSPSFTVIAYDRRAR